MANDIIKRNVDVEHIMNASCNYGLHKFGIHNSDKLLSILVLSDVHQCDRQLKSAIKYLNYYDAIDIGINLGDMQARNFAETNGKWYYKAIKYCEKPFLTLLGNHDLGNSVDKKIAANSKDAFEKFVKPAMNKSEITEVKNPYYTKYLDKYKMVVIVLNVYDIPDALDKDGNFVISRGKTCFSQQQTDWFISELQKIPQGYGVIVCLHDFPYKNDIIQCIWSQKDAITADGEENCYGNDNMIVDIVDAWINGTSINTVYKASKNYNGVLVDINVVCNFAERGNGEFISYFSGHRHQDIIAECAKYKNQKIIYFPATAVDDWQNFCSDLPREKKTKSEDALTVVSINSKDREIRLVRVGSSITCQLLKREYFILNY